MIAIDTTIECVPEEEPVMTASGSITPPNAAKKSMEQVYRPNRAQRRAFAKAQRRQKKKAV